MKQWPEASCDRRWKYRVSCGLLLVLAALITLAGCQSISAAPSNQPTEQSNAVSFGSVPVGTSKSLTATTTNNAKATVTLASTTSVAKQASLIAPSVTHPAPPVRVAGGQSISISFTPSATGSFAITSDGSNIPVTVSFSVTGTGFSVNGLNHPVTLTAGEGMTFNVTFAPQSAGNASGNLAVVSTASNQILNIPLSGTGTPVSVTGPPTGQLVVSPTSMTLGNVAVGNSSNLPASLSATGASVTVSSIDLSSSEFTLSGISFPTTIRAGQSVPFSVTFTPRVTGSASTAISFASNAHKSPAVLSLAGTGFPAPVASVTVESSSATIVPGKTHQFSATAKDARGNVITGVDFTWNSDAPPVATVDSDGLVTGMNQGTTHITATASGVPGSATVTVETSSSRNAELFGLHIQMLSTPWPSISFGGFRLYSNLGGSITRWAVINKKPGIYDFSVLDAWLAELHSHGVTNIVYTFSQVPKWASSNPNDTACDFAYNVPGYGGCDLPTDINPDGTGTNATYINFVTALARHVNNPTYLQTHAHIQYWESWNEGTEAFIRSGKVGEISEIRKFTMKDPRQASEMMKEIERVQNSGFTPREMEQMIQVVIHYRLERWGSTLDHDRRVKIEDLMNDCLIASGLGFCDGGDIGSGTINIFCEVVDAEVAERIIVDKLREKNELDGAVIAKRERAGDDEYKVVWPKDYSGKFNLF